MSQSYAASFPDAYKWKCGRCSTWNLITHGTCKKCKVPAQEAATAFRMDNKLTPEETAYYSHTAPMMLQELREIKKLLILLVKKE